MKAIIYNEYGPPEVLHSVELDKPEPKENEVLIKVHATSVSSGTLWMRRGRHPDSKIFTILIRLMNGIRKPRKKILGYEFSGEIVSKGKKVNSFEVGENIFGTTTGLKNGAYAEYLCVPKKWKQGIIAKMPPRCSYGEAAVLPIGGITALQILRKAKISEGQQVLIYGASGSVGSYAVQIAKHFGATVSGVCSNSNRAMVSKLGADFTMDYTKGEFITSSKCYDVIFDAVGKISKSMSKSKLKQGGRFLTVKTVTNEKTEYLDYLSELYKSRHIVPFVDRIYSIDQMVEAHKYVDKGNNWLFY